MNRFLQPDTIIPNLYNPQSLNRFSYVLDNPVRFSDPTGHMLWEDPYGGGCSTSGYCSGGSTYTPPPTNSGDNYCDTHPWACGGEPPDDVDDILSNQNDDAQNSPGKIDYVTGSFGGQFHH